MREKSKGKRPKKNPKPYLPISVCVCVFFLKNFKGEFFFPKKNFNHKFWVIFTGNSFRHFLKLKKIELATSRQ
jgi:hypothetical protein